jgi:hypothetical protein
MFIKDYPHLNWWVENQGWVEIGSTNESTSLLRVLDTGGNVYEDEDSEDFDRAFKRADKFLKSYIKEEFDEDV